MICDPIRMLDAAAGHVGLEMALRSSQADGLPRHEVDNLTCSGLLHQFWLLAMLYQSGDMTD